MTDKQSNEQAMGSFSLIRVNSYPGYDYVIDLFNDGDNPPEVDDRSSVRLRTYEGVNAFAHYTEMQNWCDQTRRGEIDESQLLEEIDKKFE
jgi:hypothetical protein